MNHGALFATHLVLPDLLDRVTTRHRFPWMKLSTCFAQVSKRQSHQWQLRLLHQLAKRVAAQAAPRTPAAAAAALCLRHAAGQQHGWHAGTQHGRRNTRTTAASMVCCCSRSTSPSDLGGSCTRCRSRSRLLLPALLLAIATPSAGPRPSAARRRGVMVVK